MTAVFDPLQLVEDLFTDPRATPSISPSEILEGLLSTDMRQYRRDPVAFCREVLRLEPWSYTPIPVPEGMPPHVVGDAGQLEVLEAVGDSTRRQLDGEEGVPYIHLIEAPHGVGKTYGIEAPLMLWFYSSFTPSVVFSTAPTLHQVKNLLWKDLRTHARQASERGHHIAPGLLPKDPRAEASANHFMYGQTTSDSGGKGTERAQGQHNDYQLIVFDEGEGVPDFMYDGAKRQLTGNIVRLHVMCANPKTTTSTFQKTKLHPLCVVHRMSLLGFPNVTLGRTVVPGGTSRATFNEWIEDHETFGCEIVAKHDEARHTFELPWPVPRQGGGEHPPGTVFAPKRGFLYGALGIPPGGGAGDTFVLAGRFDAALARSVDPTPESVQLVQIGVDCGRFGDDAGKVYALHRRVLDLRATIQGGEEGGLTVTRRYLTAVRDALRLAQTQGATAASVRVDGGGGYGGGIVDGLREDGELQALFPDGFVVHEVNNDSDPSVSGQTTYANIITEMYALADELLKVVRIGAHGKALKRDLTTRKYGYVTRGDRDLKRLEKKAEFKKRNSGQSPDDGDGAVLALAPERLFVPPPPPSVTTTRPKSVA